MMENHHAPIRQGHTCAIKPNPAHPSRFARLHPEQTEPNRTSQTPVTLPGDIANPLRTQMFAQAAFKNFGFVYAFRVLRGHDLDRTFFCFNCLW